MMTQLSGTSLLDMLRRKFVGSPDGLNVEMFVEAMIDVLPTGEMSKSKVETTVDLIELFKDIDVNGDGTVEWSELLAFTIEAGVGKLSLHLWFRALLPKATYSLDSGDPKRNTARPF